MNIEELKLILSTVQAAGQGAYTLAIIWFAFGFAKFLFGIGLGLIALILTERILRRTIGAVSFGGKVLNALDSHEELGYLSASIESKYLNKIRSLRDKMD